MRRGSLRTVLLVFTLAWLGAGTAVAAPAELPGHGTWRVVASSGRVEAIHDSAGEDAAWRRVTRGDLLLARTNVRSGQDGRATMILDSHIVILDPDTRVVLPQPKQGQSAATVILQSSGSAMYEVDGSTNPDVRIVTPYMVAGVKGTVFVVTVNDEYASVGVREGTVSVRSVASGRKVDIGGGQVWMASPGAPDRPEVIADGATPDAQQPEWSRGIARRENRRLQRMVNLKQALQAMERPAAGEAGVLSDVDEARGLSLDHAYGKDSPGSSGKALGLERQQAREEFDREEMVKERKIKDEKIKEEEERPNPQDTQPPADGP